MKILQLFAQNLHSLIDSIGRIFEPSDDHYPATGMIPYTGDDPDQ